MSVYLLFQILIVFRVFIFIKELRCILVNLFQVVVKALVNRGIYFLKERIFLIDLDLLILLQFNIHSWLTIVFTILVMVNDEKYLLMSFIHIRF